MLAGPPSSSSSSSSSEEDEADMMQPSIAAVMPDAQPSSSNVVPHAAKARCACGPALQQHRRGVIPSQRAPGSCCAGVPGGRPAHEREARSSWQTCNGMAEEAARCGAHHWHAPIASLDSA